MKITDIDYKTIEYAVNEWIEFTSAVTGYQIERSYQAKGLSPERCRWDIVRAAGVHILKYYNYLNDSHLDTAFKAIMRANNMQWAGAN